MAASFSRIALGILLLIAIPQAFGQKSISTPYASATNDAALKQVILQSECWRRAMFELNEWLATQPDDDLEGDEIHRILTHCVDEVAEICVGLGRELLGYGLIQEQLQQQ